MPPQHRIGGKKRSKEHAVAQNVDPKAEKISDRYHALKLDGLTSLSELLSPPRDKIPPKDKEEAGEGPVANNDDLPALKRAVNDAVTAYCAFLKDKSTDKEGKPVSFLNRVGHEKEGEERAKKFNAEIADKQNRDEALNQIMALLKDPKTRFHEHSFAIYLIDKLLQANLDVYLQAKLKSFLTAEQRAVMARTQP